ncbi:MAG: hypothetical protein ACREXP_21370, partial [Steroidobacteraceae bacterium]
VTAGRQRERSSTTEYTDALTEAQAARKQLTQIAMDAGFDLGSLSTTQVQDLSRNSAAFRDQQTVLRNALQRAQGAQGMRDRYRYGSSPTSPGHAAPYRRSSPSGNLIPSPADDLIPDPAERY